MQTLTPTCVGSKPLLMCKTADFTSPVILGYSETIKGCVGGTGIWILLKSMGRQSGEEAEIVGEGKIKPKPGPVSFHNKSSGEQLQGKQENHRPAKAHISSPRRDHSPLPSLLPSAKWTVHTNTYTNTLLLISTHPTAQHK